MIDLRSLSEPDRQLLAASPFGNRKPVDIPADWKAQLVQVPLWACFICDSKCVCVHREHEVLAAELAVRLRLREVVL